MAYTQQQIGALQNIYNYFYNYALGQGADAGTATQFAHMGIGVADTEGIHVKDPTNNNLLWGWSGDNGQSIGPFQLYKGGLGALLNGDTSPQNQLAVAAQNMWNGNADTYNTGPWFGVSRLLGVSPSQAANDSLAGQNAVETLGAKIDRQLGLSNNASVGSSLRAMTPEEMQAAQNGPASLQKLQPVGKAADLPIFAQGGATDSGYGAPIVVTDITSGGYKGFEKAAQSTEKAGETVKQGAEDVGQKIQTSEQQFAQTVTQQTTRAITQSKNLGDWFSQLTAGTSGLVARLGVGVAAIMLIGLALWLAGREQFA